MFYIVKSNVNWADEIDFVGFNLLTKKELEETKSLIKSKIEKDETVVETSIGSNEEVEITADEVLEELENAEEISREAYVIISNKIGTRFGETKLDLFLGD